MKPTNYLIAILALFLTVHSFSQERTQGPDQDKIKAYKIAFLTEKLDLTSKEAEKFWPIYNEMSEKIEKFRKEARKDMMKQVKDAGGVEAITEEQSWAIVKRNMEMQKTMIAFEESMIEKLKEVLPNKKILKLQIAEREFKKELFEKLRERRKQMREKRN